MCWRWEMKNYLLNIFSLSAAAVRTGCIYAWSKSFIWILPLLMLWDLNKEFQKIFLTGCFTLELWLSLTPGCIPDCKFCERALKETSFKGQRVGCNFFLFVKWETERVFPFSLFYLQKNYSGLQCSNYLKSPNSYIRKSDENWTHVSLSRRCTAIDCLICFSFYLSHWAFWQCSTPERKQAHV